jgi:phospholipid transport system substrate-binding protein
LIMFERLITKTKPAARLRWIIGVATAAFWLCLLVPTAATAGAPSEQIQGAIEKVVATLKDPALKAKKQERLEQLRQVLYPKFDFAEMAKRSLGSHWQKRSADEQRDFVKLFTELIENAYLDNLEAYDGEKVAITGEKQDKEFAEVNSKVATKKGEEIAINYKLHQAGGSDWKVYDVVIENVSLVNNYRSQFNRVIAQSSYEDLFSKMKGKQFEAGGKKPRA